MMWDILLYMCRFYWLKKQATLVHGSAEYSRLEEIYRESRQSQRDAIQLQKEKDTIQNLTQLDTY